MKEVLLCIRELKRNSKADPVGLAKKKNEPISPSTQARWMEEYPPQGHCILTVKHGQSAAATDCFPSCPLGLTSVEQSWPHRSKFSRFC